MTRQEILARFPNASESTLRRNLGIKGLGYDLYDLNTKQKVASYTPKPRMNKLELRFYEILKDRLRVYATITPQFRIRISRWDAPVPCFYTADFLISESCNLHQLTIGKLWKHTLYEVKDKRRKPHSDELTRPKLCRQHNPWISAVILATWDGQAWTEKQIA